MHIINISFYFLLFPILRVYVWSIMRIIGGGRIRMRMRRKDNFDVDGGVKFEVESGKDKDEFGVN